jgi:Xaa-Pro aminopeptidase
VNDMNNLQILQERLRKEGIDFLVIPSTDEYLSEFCQPFARRLEWVTGFTGSTGEAIVSQSSAALFLDGRYLTQGRRETEGTAIEVLEQSQAARACWLGRNLRRGMHMGADPSLHAYGVWESLREAAVQHAGELKELNRNPIDDLWQSGRPARSASTILDYSMEFCGIAAAEKCGRLARWLAREGIDWYLLADPEDVAWLLNVRTRDILRAQAKGWHVLPIPLCRALVAATGRVFWFVDEWRLDPALRKRLQGQVTVLAPGRLEPFLAESGAGKVVAADLRRTPYRFGAIVARVGKLKDDAIVPRWRWKKNPVEIERAKEGHFRDGQAVIRFLCWLQRSVRERTVTELDGARKLAELRGEIAEYLGPSMPLMSASGPNGSLAHYVPDDRSNRAINDHPIYWMDSGGQYLGCSTDNTVCISLSTPEPRQVRAHTLVVKGYIALACARFPDGTYSNQLDALARQFLWNAGLDYSHGTGHGVGSFMNIHEGPFIQRDPKHPMVAPLEAGMIVSNEPGYYVENDYGIRIESHLLTVTSQHKGFLEFETISRLPIDPRLIDWSIVTMPERQWLENYHCWIVREYKGALDRDTSEWLENLSSQYLLK